MCLSAVGRQGRPCVAHHSSLRCAKQSSRRFGWSARSRPRLTTGFGGATAAGLRFQEGRNVPELVSDGRSVDSPERAAHVQSSFVLQHLHAELADGGVYVLVDPRPWDRRHLRQIARPGNAAHIATTNSAVCGRYCRLMVMVWALCVLLMPG